MGMSDRFDVPVVLIIFRRAEKSAKIVERIAQVRPSKLYLISDEGRTETERLEVARCRAMVEESITWDCEVEKDYATENKGVYDRIGLGALRVFRKERWAIFLEDDNLPEVSFFHYCRELLTKYEQNERVLWVCGTNYLGTCEFQNGSDYGFTKHMLPCGWASWASKFSKYYDKHFEACNRKTLRDLRRSYSNYALFIQDKRNWLNEMQHYQRTNRYTSWDYHMGFTLRANNLLGVVPRANQIVNIGVDEVSEHGGVSMHSEMTTRLCSMVSFPLSFPLKHPTVVQTDEEVERQLASIITWPLIIRVKNSAPLSFVIKRVRAALGVPANIGIKQYLRFRRTP